MRSYSIWEPSHNSRTSSAAPIQNVSDFNIKAGVLRETFYGINLTGAPIRLRDDGYHLQDWSSPLQYSREHFQFLRFVVSTKSHSIENLVSFAEYIATSRRKIMENEANSNVQWYEFVLEVQEYLFEEILRRGCLVLQESTVSMQWTLCWYFSLLK